MLTFWPAFKPQVREGMDRGLRGLDLRIWHHPSPPPDSAVPQNLGVFKGRTPPGCKAPCVRTLAVSHTSADGCIQERLGKDGPLPL